MRPTPFTPPFQVYIGNMRHGEEIRDLDDARLVAKHLRESRGIKATVVDRNAEIAFEWLDR